MSSGEVSGKRRFKGLVDVAMKAGATRARVISTDSLLIDERVRLKCMAPLCDNYGRHLLCPPNVMTVEESRKMIGKYGHALLIQLDAPYASTDRSHTTLDARMQKDIESRLSENRLHRIVNEVECAAFKNGHYLAAGLIASNCALCRDCVGAGSEKPCRHPFEARPSMQSMGIDVIATCEHAGMPVRLSSKEKVRWTGAVLLS